ncbi:MAG: CRISPR-associated protein Cas5 [Cyclobacteriaceae bacterium]
MNFAIEILSQTASFRNPDFQNFHKSLDLPPPTTIVGLAGAALGLSPLQAQEFFEFSGCKIGVYGVYLGKCSDTWKYNKEIRDMRTYDPGKDGSIIQKEYLIYSQFIIAFESKNSNAISKLIGAFQNPKYALTMGNSDSLALIKNMEFDLPVVSSTDVENCLLEGDVIDSVIRFASEKIEFSIYSTSEPLTYDLPLKFQYTNDYGRRTVSQVGTFSMIGKKMKLNYSVEGLMYKNLFVPLINL